MRPDFKKLKTKVKTPKGKVIAASIGIVLITTATFLVIYWNQIKKGLIHQKVKDTVADKTDHLYKFRFDNLEMDEVEGNLTVTNMQLHYDSSRYLLLKQQGKAPGALFSITIPQLIVRNVQTPEALISKELKGGKLQISNPIIKIAYTNEGADSTQRVPTNAIYKQILGDLNLIHLDTLLITGARILTSNLKTGKTELEIANLWLQLKDIAIDSLANRDTTRLMFAKSIALQCPQIAWKSGSKLYDFVIDSLHLVSDENRVSAKSLKIVPLLSETAFADKKKVAADRFDIQLNQVNISDLQFQQLLQQEIDAGSVSVKGSSIKIYRENNREHDGKNRIGTYPQQRVMQIPIPVNIRSLQLENTYVEYKEKGKAVEKTGKVIFSQLDAHFRNITNITGNIKTDNRMTAEVKARFLKKFPVSTKWIFYLGNPKGRFDLSGTAGSMDGATINTLAEPLGGASIEEGRVKSLDFDFKADDYKTTGTVKFLYNDLKIALLKREEDSDDLKKKKLASFGANIIIKNNNPSNNGKVRIATIDYTRDTTRSMFNMAWKALREGIKETALPN